MLDASVVSNATYQAVAFYLSSGAVAQSLAGNGIVKGNVFASSTASLVPGGSNSIGTLSFSNNLSLANMTASFELNTATTPGNGVNDLVNVGGDLDPNGATIFVTALTPLTSPGTYRLFNYNGAELHPVSYAGVQTDTRYTFALDDSTTKQVNLLVSGSSSSLVWSGGGGATWDLLYSASPNWDSDSQYFYNADSVTFDDTSPNNAVNITGTVRPASVLVTNTSANYVFSGSGKITGLTGVTKAGSGTLILNDANNDFTGPVTVNGGTLGVSSFATSGSPSVLGAGTTITLNGGTFQFGGARPSAGTVNRYWTLGANGGTILSTNGTFFLANQISGLGSFTKTGTNQVILGDIVTGVLSTGASNTYSGNTYVTQGELQLRNNHALGFGKAVVSSGADLAFGGGANYGTITNNIDLNGGDGNGGGALQVNDANTQVTYGGTINLLSSSSIGSLDKGAITYNISGQIIGSGALKKLSTNTITFTCTSNLYSGGTTISNGFLQLGSGAGAGTLGSGPATNYAALVFNHSDTTTNSAVISGTGTLTHKGTGTLVLNGASTYTGATTVNGGTLAVNGSLGATTIAVGNGATLSGYGMIGGPVTINSGGTLALGASIGKLTINNVLNLAGTNVMKVGHATNDVVQGISTVTFGGALTITTSGSPQAGDSFKLFNATTYAGAFTATNLPALGGNLDWDTSRLTNGTLKVISTFVPQPVFNPPYHRADGNLQFDLLGPSQLQLPRLGDYESHLHTDYRHLVKPEQRHVWQRAGDLHRPQGDELPAAVLRHHDTVIHVLFRSTAAGFPIPKEYRPDSRLAGTRRPAGYRSKRLRSRPAWG